MVGIKLTEILLLNSIQTRIMVPQHLTMHWIEFPKSRLTVDIVKIVALNNKFRSKSSSVLDKMRDNMLGN